MHILLAEDECVTRESARITLEDHGHRVTAVTNGAAALEAFSGQPFDIVFMDIKMPGMDGLEATRRIRAAEDQAQRVPIIALSGFSHGELPEYESAGIDDLIEKPFKYTQLLSTLRRYSA
ncbi:response regulator [Desulfocurvus sp. DL9XJH121]